MAPMLSRGAARTLYNAADALLPPAPGAVAVDWVPGVEAALAARGPEAGRRLVRVLRRLEWEPLLGPEGRCFSQLDRPARAARLTRWAGHPRRAADRELLAALLAEAGASLQSASGA